ncbi:MAG: M3 family oligoendopeptidase [bacterium]
MDKKYLDISFKVTDYKDVASYFEELAERRVSSAAELEELISDYGKLVEAFQEDYGWAYINMTRDTSNKDYRERFSLFNDKIGPEVDKITFIINKKIADSVFSSQLRDTKWNLFLKRLDVNVQIFSEKNVPLKTEISNLAVDYQEKVGSIMIDFQGKEYTPSQMTKFFESKERHIRKEAFDKVVEKRLSMKDEINEIFMKMTSLRHKTALNAGESNYTDFRFKELERFDYSTKECEEFHQSVLEVCTPILGEIIGEKKKRLGVADMMPYDAHATMPEDEVLKPFADASDFIEKSRQVFASIDDRFLKVFESVNSDNKLDLESRKGKAPGGYNYPLYKSGLPFIFMNASGSNSDMRTLMHESGHAVHTVKVKDMFTYFYKNTPSEVAELASMGMEMITYDRWKIFYNDEKQLKQAQRKQLEGIITFFPWCAIVDKFQHHVYANPESKPEDLLVYFNTIATEYQEKYFDWSGYKNYLPILWQMQIHIFEVPFYYIEYGMAQLGALQLWKNYLDDPKKTIEMYLKGLSLGSSVSIADVYSTMGVSFDFSRKKMEELMKFAYSEYRKVLS